MGYLGNGHCVNSCILATKKRSLDYYAWRLTGWKILYGMHCILYGSQGIRMGIAFSFVLLNSRGGRLTLPIALHCIIYIKCRRGLTSYTVYR